MTDAQLAARILEELSMHGLLTQRRLKRHIDPPGGERAVRRVLAVMATAGKVWPRNHYGSTAYGLQPAANRPQNAKPRQRHVNQYDEPAGTVNIREIAPGRRIVTFGRDWRSGKGLTQRHAVSVQSGMNSIYMGV